MYYWCKKRGPSKRQRARNLINERETNDENNNDEHCTRIEVGSSIGTNIGSLKGDRAITTNFTERPFSQASSLIMNTELVDDESKKTDVDRLKRGLGVSVYDIKPKVHLEGNENRKLTSPTTNKTSSIINK